MVGAAAAEVSSLNGTSPSRDTETLPSPTDCRSEYLLLPPAPDQSTFQPPFKNFEIR